MNGKKIFYCVIAFIMLFISCESTAITDTELVARNSFCAGKLEATVEGLDYTVERSRARLATAIENSRGIEDTVARIEYLFNAYEYEVRKLIEEVSAVRAEVKETCEVNNGWHNNSSGGNLD